MFLLHHKLHIYILVDAQVSCLILTLFLLDIFSLWIFIWLSFLPQALVFRHSLCNYSICHPALHLLRPPISAFFASFLTPVLSPNISAAVIITDVALKCEEELSVFACLYEIKLTVHSVKLYSTTTSCMLEHYRCTNIVKKKKCYGQKHKLVSKEINFKIILNWWCIAMSSQPSYYATFILLIIFCFNHSLLEKQNSRRSISVVQDIPAVTKFSGIERNFSCTYKCWPVGRSIWSDAVTATE